MALIFLLLLVSIAGVGVGLLAALAIYLRLLFSLIDALVQQVPRGITLFCRLLVRSVRAARVLHRLMKRGGLWVAQHAYVWLFVWSYRLRRAYVASELKKRRLT